MSGRRLARRLAQLYAGLVLYGASDALIVRAGLGNVPWDVLHQGVARRTALTIGTVTVLVSVVVLAAWVPLRQRPGLGTVSNALLVGVSLDAALALLPHPAALATRAALSTTGVLLNAVATAAYIGARFGPGPRDGLMTGLVRRTGGSVRAVRTSLEVVVVAVGAALGGTLGLATLGYALAIGPLVQLLLPWLDIAPPVRPAAPPRA